MMTGSMLDPHVLIPNSGSIQLVRAMCRLVKSVNNAGVLQEAMQINPNVVTVMRYDDPRVTAEDLRRDFPNNPQAAAQRWIDIYRPKLIANPNLKQVESPNEPVFKTSDNRDDLIGLKWLNDFLIALSDLLHAMGFRMVGPNFSTGYPSIESWSTLLSLLRKMLANGDIVSIHGYSVVSPDQDNDNTNRLEQIYDRILVPNGLGDMWLMYGEWGEIEYKADLFDSNHNLIRRALSDEEYAARLIAGDARLRVFKNRARNFLGATIFTFGSDNEAWTNYNVGNDGNKAPPILTNHIRNTPEIIEPVPPPVAVPPRLFDIGQRIKVTDRVINGTPTRALNVRRDPVNGFIGTPIRAVASQTEGDILSDPFYALLGTSLIEWVRARFVNGVEGNVSQRYLDPVFVIPPPPPVPNPTPVNLLKNWSFENGYYHWHGIPELATPNEWDFWYQGDVNIRLERQDSPFFPLEGVVWNRAQAPEHEKDIFWINGQFCLKEFKGWGPIWWRISQTVHGLTIGKTYEFTAPVYPDLVMKYDDQGNKIWADDPLAGEVKLYGGPVESDWKNGNDFPFGQYTHHKIRFVADSESEVVSLECRGRWGLVNNGFFVDALTLFEVQ